MSMSPKSSEKGESPRTAGMCNEEEVDIRQASKSTSCARHRGAAVNTPTKGLPSWAFSLARETHKEKAR